MKTRTLFLFIGCLTAFSLTAQQSQNLYPKPYGALPSQQQLRWQEIENYVLVHFTPTTFEDKEWGFGDADPEIFNPKDFNASQIVNAAKAGGFKGLIFVAKHHDGFCLWPTKTTPYNISKSPFRNGKGDMVKEFEMATRKAGLQFGVYCSPWDRNFPGYGKPEYVKAYREQLTELYSNYGKLFITWFDGANGGDGYYGGTRETRKIDNKTYYGWDSIWKMVRKLQPESVIFNNLGDVRWVGNEEGYAASTSWATFTLEYLIKKDVVPGEEDLHKLEAGTRNGLEWKPAECDVPLRPGWFYHASQDNKVKTVSQLFDLYCKSVGRGAALDLGISPNKQGLLHNNDVTILKAFGNLLQQTFALNLAKTAVIKTNNVRGKNSTLFGVKNLTDNNLYSYWATDDAVTNPWMELQWKQAVTFNIIRLRENIKLGQRIEKVEVDAIQNGEWIKIGEATSIGANRIIRLPRFITASKIRIRIESPVCVALSEVSVFKEPEMLPLPQIKRTKEGNIFISTPDPVHAIHYTTDGSQPTLQSPLYTAPFLFDKSGLIKARAFSSKNISGEIAAQTFGTSKKDWKVLNVSYESKAVGGFAANAIDDDPETIWHTWESNKEMKAPPQEIAVDMGETKNIMAFTYLPRASGTWGVAKNYEWQVSNDGINWQTVADGEFANIKANPIEQLVTLKQPVTCRYFKFIGKTCVEDNYISAAELGAVVK